MDDSALIHGCLRGDSRAWDQLVDLYGPVVHDAARYTLRRVLGSAQDGDIENCVQTVFVALCEGNMRRLRSFRGKSSFKTWITSVTTRFTLNYIRSEKRKGSLKYCQLEDSLGEQLERDEFSSLPSEEAEKLYRAMEQLPARDRLLLNLFYFDGVSYRTIAEILRIPVNSVSPLLTRAKDALKKLVGSP